MNQENNVASHLDFWNSVKKTDPKHTKPVKFGPRAFTSIDPMWQIQRATEHLGRVGEGWTYAAEYRFIDTMVTCEVTIHYKDAEGADCAYGPVMGAEEYKTHMKDRSKELLYHPNGEPIYRFDTDAPKKAMTDALTKALSHLGFNADVFLGLFDDQKYVARMRNEFSAEEASEQLKNSNSWANSLMDQVRDGEVTLAEAKASIKAKAQSLDKAVLAGLVGKIQKLETEIADKEAKT